MILLKSTPRENGSGQSTSASITRLGVTPELRKAHQENDRAVMAAYGFSTKMTESECVAELFKMYQELTK